MGSPPAHRRLLPRFGAGPLALALLAGLAAAPARLAAQAPAAPPAGATTAQATTTQAPAPAGTGATPAAAPDVTLGTPALESALAAEPVLEPEPRRGPSPWTIGLLLGAVAAVAAGVGLAMHLRRDREPLPEEPFLVFAPPPTAPPARPMRIQAPPRPVPAPTLAPQAVGAMAARPRPAPAAPTAPAVDPDDELTVRLEVPAEGRLQFLPGALEVVEGTDRQREIRFLRTGDAVPEYTLGRTAGPPTRHVQISAPTVSRRHARMRFADGAWTISNLSSTNPLRVNGRELSPGEEGRMLSDGDRIEVGEVVLRFRGPAR